MNSRVAIQESGTGHVAGTTGRWRARLIEANRWGSTAYYPAEVLERDGPRVFVAGTQMFEDHLTDDEKWNRPEGSVGKLVGKLVSDATFENDGLYADVEFYESYRDRIKEIGNDIGLSVRASGLTEEAEMDGRYGPVLLAFLAAESVDVVTRAGAGGKLTSILESDRELAGRPVDDKEGTQSVTDVTKEDFDALGAKLTELIEGLSATLKESLAGEKPAEEKPEGDVEKTTEKTEEKTEEKTVEIDHAAIAEALRTNELPGISAQGIVADLKEGKTLEDAVKHAIEIRESYLSTAPEAGTVHIQESAGGNTTKHGLARAVEVLG